jgi:hypothetical protein
VIVGFELSVLADPFVICRMEPAAPWPVWVAAARGLVSVTRTDDELSIICRRQDAPAADVSSDEWRALKLHGPFPLDAVGVLAAVSGALADARVSMLALATHDTDYLFVHARALPAAVRALRHAGHTVHLQS